MTNIATMLPDGKQAKANLWYLQSIESKYVIFGDFVAAMRRLFHILGK